jgi:hypothetical protein
MALAADRLVMGAWRLASTNLWLTTASEGQDPGAGLAVRPNLSTAVATEDKEKAKKVRLFFAH